MKYLRTNWLYLPFNFEIFSSMFQQSHISLSCLLLYYYSYITYYCGGQLENHKKVKQQKVIQKGYIGDIYIWIRKNAP